MAAEIFCSFYSFHMRFKTNKELWIISESLLCLRLSNVYESCPIESKTKVIALHFSYFDPYATGKAI